VSGLVTSQIWFGWATEEDLQPNIDGLSFDEVLLFGLLGGVVGVVVTRVVARRRLARTGSTGHRGGARDDGSARRSGAAGSGTGRR
jgi:hypothetical protein